MANIRVSRKSGFIQRSGRMRRETLWIGIVDTNQALASANSAAIFTGLSATDLALRPFTVVRTLMQLFVQSDQKAADEFYHTAIGMAVVSDQALAIGITAVPTPISDVDSDLFFLYGQVRGEINIVSASGALETGHTANIDSRAMRKVEDGSDIAIAIENGSQSSGTNVAKGGRMLVKLH